MHHCLRTAPKPPYLYKREGKSQPRQYSDQNESYDTMHYSPHVFFCWLPGFPS